MSNTIRARLEMAAVATAFATVFVLGAIAADPITALPIAGASAVLIGLVVRSLQDHDQNADREQGPAHAGEPGLDGLARSVRRPISTVVDGRER